MKKTTILALIIIILSFLISIYFYPQLPDQMASHWNSKGEVDDYMSKFWGSFLMPIVSLGILLLFIFIPKIDPLKKNIQAFRKYYDMFIIIMILFLFYIHILTLLWSLNIKYNMTQMLIPAIAILFYYISILMKNSKRNWFIGIRTPWTLSNDKVWEKTHKLGSKLFKISAIIILIGTFFEKYFILFIIAPVLFTTVSSIIYSYFEYKKLK